MKKLFSAIIITMMIALAFTIVAGAEETVYYPDTDGYYSFSYDVEATAGTQFGMVVIEATDETSEDFVLDDNSICYIDQVGADDEGKITFDSFAPKDKADTFTYKVYIGGGELEEATYIGILSVEAAADDTVAVEDVNIEQETASVEVGKTVTLVATVTPDNATDKTVTWSASNGNATVVDGVVNGVAAGEVVITATAGEVSDTCTVTVTAAEQGGSSTAKLGDVDGDEELTTTDAYMVVRFAIGYDVDNFNEDVCDIDEDEEPTTTDAYMIVRKAIGYSVPALDSVWPEL